jgi:hypothetical protein
LTLFFGINEIWDIIKKSTEEELLVNQIHITHPHCWEGLVFQVNDPEKGEKRVLFGVVWNHKNCFVNN